MVKELSLTKMDRDLKANGLMTKSMDRENSITLTVTSTRANLQTVNLMAMANTSSLTEIFT